MRRPWSSPRSSLLDLILGFIPFRNSYRSGIGLESALLFASEGANVVLGDVNLPAAEAAVALIEKAYGKELGVKAIALKADVSKEQEVQSLVDLAVKEFGRLDVMVRIDTMQPAGRNGDR